MLQLTTEKKPMRETTFAKGNPVDDGAECL